MRIRHPHSRPRPHSRVLTLIGADRAAKKGITYLGDGSSAMSAIRQFGVTEAVRGEAQ
ncbi:hypothetical protein [Streptomyces flaveus]|uniref:Uncharacterized protein n=1 Tax=Streptomyces flaveus TaxID=66370 RepID=A0A917VC06_9ACTN|nr:hypothetical protein [Streptomyces flaveus]GGK59696.1 hypothetical protein GCM10010094_20100 [Streptomyces flaveus]